MIWRWYCQKFYEMNQDKWGQFSQLFNFLLYRGEVRGSHWLVHNVRNELEVEPGVPLTPSNTKQEYQEKLRVYTLCFIV